MILWILGVQYKRVDKLQVREMHEELKNFKDAKAEWRFHEESDNIEREREEKEKDVSTVMMQNRKNRLLQFKFKKMKKSDDS